jgi:hypothetical protein
MQSFLAKCAALGIVAGGFAVTGDLGRLADRGQRLLEASTVPSETPPDAAAGAGDAPPHVTEPPTAAGPSAAPQPTLQPSAAPQPLATEPVRPAAREALFDPPLGRAFVVPAPPATGPESIDLERLTAGSRLLVWVRRPGAANTSRTTDLIALDLIDPHAGEALEHRHAALTHGSQTVPVHVSPRRVVISRDAGGRVAKGAVLRLSPLRGVNGLGTEETAGTILAVDVQGR